MSLIPAIGQQLLHLLHAWTFENRKKKECKGLKTTEKIRNSSPESGKKRNQFLLTSTRKKVRIKFQIPAFSRAKFGLLNSTPFEYALEFNEWLNVHYMSQSGRAADFLDSACSPSSRRPGIDCFVYFIEVLTKVSMLRSYWGLTNGWTYIKYHSTKSEYFCSIMEADVRTLITLSLRLNCFSCWHINREVRGKVSVPKQSHETWLM